MMTDMRPLLAISLVTLLLTACGQTGPLYLPGHEPDGKLIAKAPAAVPAEAEKVEAEKVEEATADEPAPAQGTK